MAQRFQARFRHGAPLMVDHTPAAAVAAGEVVTVGGKLRIAHNDIAADQLGALAAPGGQAVYRVAKASGGGVTFADGAAVYWDDTQKVAVATGPGDGTLGVAVAAAADADDYVDVKHEDAGPA